MSQLVKVARLRLLAIRRLLWRPPFGSSILQEFAFFRHPLESSDRTKINIQRIEAVFFENAECYPNNLDDSVHPEDFRGVHTVHQSKFRFDCARCKCIAPPSLESDLNSFGAKNY